MRQSWKMFPLFKNPVFRYSLFRLANLIFQWDPNPQARFASSARKPEMFPKSPQP